MVTKALLEVSMEGLGPNGTTSIFPCGIFQIMKGVNKEPGTPNYDLKRLALKSTTQRIYPNYANVDWSIDVNARMQDRKDKKEYIESLTDDEISKLYTILSKDKSIADKLDIICKEDGELQISYEAHPYEIFSTMGCRTANGFDINFLDEYKRNIQHLLNTGKLFQEDYLSASQKDGRGNICPATIILPTLAMRARLSVEKSEYNESDIIDAFLKLLDKKIDECKDSLIERFNWICKQSYKAAKFMYENGTMFGYVAEEGLFSALKHGTLAIGQLGLAETLCILIGKDHTTKEGMDLAKQIESLFNTRCKEYKEKYKLNFGVYYTPAENLCHTAFKKWKKEFGDYEGVTYYIENGNRIEKKFFTNSMHVPVYDDVTAFEKIDIESQLTGYSNAGCITYVEVPAKAKNNIEAIETLLDYMVEHDIPYSAFNFPIDRCLNPECNYQGEIENNVCPKCGCTHIEHLGRVTGYLTGSVYDAFNDGKIDEFSKRKDHTDKEIKEED